MPGYRLDDNPVFLFLRIGTVDGRHPAYDLDQVRVMFGDDFTTELFSLRLVRTRELDFDEFVHIQGGVYFVVHVLTQALLTQHDHRL